MEPGSVERQRWVDVEEIEEDGASEGVRIRWKRARDETRLKERRRKRTATGQYCWVKEKDAGTTEKNEE